MFNVVFVFFAVVWRILRNTRSDPSDWTSAGPERYAGHILAAHFESCSGWPELVVVESSACASNRTGWTACACSWTARIGAWSPSTIIGRPRRAHCNRNASRALAARPRSTWKRTRRTSTGPVPFGSGTISNRWPSPRPNYSYPTISTTVSVLSNTLK